MYIGTHISSVKLYLSLYIADNKGRGWKEESQRLVGVGVNRLEPHNTHSSNDMIENRKAVQSASRIAFIVITSIFGYMWPNGAVNCCKKQVMSACLITSVINKCWNGTQKTIKNVFRLYHPKETELMIVNCHLQHWTQTPKTKYDFKDIRLSIKRNCSPTKNKM